VGMVVATHAEDAIDREMLMVAAHRKAGNGGRIPKVGGCGHGRLSAADFIDTELSV
jgi:hypothetical protein